MSPDPAAQPPVPADAANKAHEADAAHPADAHVPAPVDWSEESTAGEEDPGASLDLALEPPAQPVPGGEPPAGGPPASRP
ncbi:hypothetical protein [Azohydromonas lata]|uniref:Uncharacterized protein n=1 Tax=Azohydromonas lata TaxID=45677 RepID=A0ABU5IQ80_9BURK|nr:hypothetical protein [Azohydromonas lata]MDZ5461062.1 hypothetical protein [Azohydromonas lata]